MINLLWEELFEKRKPLFLGFCDRSSFGHYFVVNPEMRKSELGGCIFVNQELSQGFKWYHRGIASYVPMLLWYPSLPAIFQQPPKCEKNGLKNHK